MGLLAVIGPSTKDHFGAPLRKSRNLSSALVSPQNFRMEYSCATKSTLFGTSLNVIKTPAHLLLKTQRLPSLFGTRAVYGSRGTTRNSCTQLRRLLLAAFTAPPR